MTVETSPGAIVPGQNDDRASQVWERLALVTDPELDEPVTDLEFVTRVDVDADDRVHIGWRLPTYWCAPNFAFMMADDMRSATLALPWVKGVTVELGEHMYDTTINKGVSEGRSFQEAFGDEADGELDEVRRTFLLKAFQRRQEALILHLRDAGVTPSEIVAWRIADLEASPADIEAPPADIEAPPADDERRKLVDRYMQRRWVAGPVSPAAFAFVTTAGDPLQAEGFDTYLNALRRVRVNTEFNGALCRGLLAVRFDTTTPLGRKAEPATAES